MQTTQCNVLFYNVKKIFIKKKKITGPNLNKLNKLPLTFPWSIYECFPFYPSLLCLIFGKYWVRMHQMNKSKAIPHLKNDTQNRDTTTKRTIR